MSAPRPFVLAAGVLTLASATAPAAWTQAAGRRAPLPSTASPAQASSQAPSGGAATFDSLTLAGIRWRSIGPANMGGRITGIAGIPSPSKTFYVAAALGGIWKTTNAGTTFRPVFDNERCISMGDVAIAPSDTNVIYAGTGEEDSRNSISPGCGMFKSTDGGKSWTAIGLERVGAIGRIVVHPRDPNTLYVAALGQPWAYNRERGLYKSTDGGKSWQLAKFVSDRAGFVDVAMDPTNPDVLYASSWERIRGVYFLKSGGPGSGLWKTTDGGKTWTEIRGGGFPETMKGRIGIAIAQSNPNVVYALVEADSLRGANAAERTPFPASATDTTRHRRTLLSGLYRSDDAGRTWRWMNPNDVRPFYYSQVRVHPRNPDKVWWSSTPVNFSEDGGKTIRQATLGIHVDHHAMWIDPNDPDHLIVGDDGGVDQSWDGGGNYDFLNQMPLGQFYEVSYDMAVPYRVCGGLQDNGSWCGPSRRRTGEIVNANWFTINGGDGFFTAQDPTDPNILYGESQGGNIARVNYATGERTPLVKPQWRPRYLQIEDSILVLRPDTTRPAPGAVTREITELRKQQRTDSIDLDLRFNWNTPFFLSAHDPSVFYVGGNRVLKSTKRGDELFPISPDLSKKEWARIDTSMKKTGGITNDATGAETYGTVVALAESPVRPGLLFAGTDDGNIWLTRSDGASWESLDGRFPGVPTGTYVRRFEPSHFDSATVYVAFDNHRRNDYTPYLYVSTDFGRTFRSIVNDLPRGGIDYVHVIREDPYNRDLLFVGTDVGAYVSRDRGAHWQRFMTGLPTVPVHDLKIHPREHELIAATHGRSLWIANILPLEQLTDSVLRQPIAFFKPKVAYQYGEPPLLGESPGQKVFAADSPPYGAELVYRITPAAVPATAARADGQEQADGDSARAGRRSGMGRARGPQARIVITDAAGDTVRTLTGPATAGLHSVAWDFRGTMPPGPHLSPAQRRDSVIAARKMDQTFDSLQKEGIPKPALDEIRQAIATGETAALMQRFGGGRRRGAPGEFVERPGESPPPRRGARAGGEQAGGAGGPLAGLDEETLSNVFSALRASGALRGGGFFGGGPQRPVVATGDYEVTLEVGGQRLRQLLRVEKVSGGHGEAVRTGEDDTREP